jgi:WD40 repeat protein
MLRGDDHWLIQDANSGLYKLWLATNDIQKIYEVHSGPVYGLQVAPPECKLHMAITCGRDASVRCWDLQAGAQVFSRSFNKPARSLLW